MYPFFPTFSLPYRSLRLPTIFSGVTGDLGDPRTISICSSPTGLPGRCSRAYHAKAGLKISLTYPRLVLSIRYVLTAIKVVCRFGRANPCWCVTQLGVNTKLEQILIIWTLNGVCSCLSKIIYILVATCGTRG
jgi:hypothetical protein